MPQHEDFYAILGVAKDASQDEIRKAYRKLSLKWHPDKNGNSEESTTRFQEISRAYEILGDPNKRREYDRFGSQGKAFEGFSFHNPEDIFRQFEEQFGTFFADSSPFGFGRSRNRDFGSPFASFGGDFGSFGSFGGSSFGSGSPFGSTSFSSFSSSQGFGNGSFSSSQSTVIRNGKKVTTKTKTVVENGVPSTVTETIEEDLKTGNVKVLSSNNQTSTPMLDK